MTSREPGPLPSRTERVELDELRRTLQANIPRVSRRDLLRWSAITAGALATSRLGLKAASAAPGAAQSAATARYADEIEKNVTITVPFDAYGQTVTLDPHRSIPYGGFWVVFPNVWGGLLRYDETGKVQTDLAESYTKSDDGLTYTFKIRPDAKYASGRPVLAAHFVASWQRALNPDNISPMSQFMSPVKGYGGYVAKKSTDIGFKAVDDKTVQITLSKPYSFFLSYLAAFVWAVIDPDVLKAAGDTGFILKDAGTGPWRFTAFDAASQFVMEPNTNHYGGNSPSLAKIVWPIITGPSALGSALDLYKQNQAVIADIPLSLKLDVEGDATLSKELVKITPSGFTRSLAMDFSKPPFDDVRVRRAFAMAIDRQKWCTSFWLDTWTPTEVFTPPVVQTTAGYKAPDGIKLDANGAKKLLADAGFPNGQGIPEITFYESSSDDADEMTRYKALLQMFKDVLGVEVKQDTTKTADQIQNLQSDDGGRQFDVVTWQNVTETPYLLSQVFRTDSPAMKGVFNWSEQLKPKGGFDPGADAKQFNKLTAQADVEQDQAKRNDLYRQAEALALKNAVYVPIANWVQMFVQKPWLKGTKQGTWTGSLPVWFNKDVVVVKH